MTFTPALADRDELAAAAVRARDVIRGLQDSSGAYPASPTFPAYRGYCWLRDGAFIADGMSAGGAPDSAEAFFDWCARTIEGRADRIREIADAAAREQPIADDRMMPTRFAFDGSDGHAEWWDFQLDGYGLWIWAVHEHIRRHGTDPARWLPAIELTVDYLVSSWQRPCYDWWEEHVEQVHVSTLGSVVAGLRAAASLPGVDASRRRTAEVAAASALEVIHRNGVVDGHLIKWLGSTAVDASLASLVAPLGVLDPSSHLAVATITRLDEDLVVDGGMHRFLSDTYYGGGQWPLLSCLLGLAMARADRPDRAEGLLRWAAGTVRDGAMPEQVPTHLLAPDRVAEWVDRWGDSAHPLLWSEAMFLRLATELGVLDARRVES